MKSKFKNRIYFDLELTLTSTHLSLEMENDLISAFKNRVENWKTTEFVPQEFSFPTFTEVKCPTENKPPIANRFATGKGIQSRDRYNFVEKTRDVLSKMIPFDKSLAREVADKWEKDIFEHSSNYSVYAKETKERYSRTKMNLDMQQKLPKI